MPSRCKAGSGQKKDHCLMLAVGCQNATHNFGAAWSLLARGNHPHQGMKSQVQRTYNRETANQCLLCEAREGHRICRTDRLLRQWQLAIVCPEFVNPSNQKATVLQIDATSARGQNGKSPSARVTSACLPGADIGPLARHVRSVPTGDIIRSSRRRSGRAAYANFSPTQLNSENAHHRSPILRDGV
jgi:hypothetical protein